MYRRLAIAGFAVAVAAVVLLPHAAQMSAQHAVRNADRSWAPAAAYAGARMSMRFLRYGMASEQFEAALAAFPHAPWAPDAVFQLALCSEKQGRTAIAEAQYARFVRDNPAHAWRRQALARLAVLRAAR
jgi:outer membrane protein assembly factor BamD (BamD/ComL family)